MTGTITGGGSMIPSGASFGITSRHLPGRGNLTTARQRFPARRTTGIAKPSRGIVAFGLLASPVILPTTSNQSFPGATAISFRLKPSRTSEWSTTATG